MGSCLFIDPSLLMGVRSKERTITSQRLLPRFGFGAAALPGVVASGAFMLAGNPELGLAWISVQKVAST